ncbi:hypothetical protein Bhyg_08844, partial [Pseudolycoriella hygida]
INIYSEQIVIIYCLHLNEIEQDRVNVAVILVHQLFVFTVSEVHNFLEVTPKNNLTGLVNESELQLSSSISNGVKVSEVHNFLEVTPKNNLTGLVNESELQLSSSISNGVKGPTTGFPQNNQSDEIQMNMIGQIQALTSEVKRLDIIEKQNAVIEELRDHNKELREINFRNEIEKNKYCKIRQILEATKIFERFTYENKQTRSLKVMARGLHPQTPIDDIKEDPIL